MEEGFFLNRKAKSDNYRDGKLGRAVETQNWGA